MSKELQLLQNQKNLFLAITELESLDEVKSFLEDLLSIEELKEFSNRWQVAKLLNDKVPYTQITESTGASSTTIARISKCLNRDNSGYRTILSKIQK